jgi:hypothetical protein
MAVLLLQAAFVNEFIPRCLRGGDTALAVPLTNFEPIGLDGDDSVRIGSKRFTAGRQAYYAPLLAHWTSLD